MPISLQGSSRALLAGLAVTMLSCRADRPPGGSAPAAPAAETAASAGPPANVIAHADLASSIDRAVAAFMNDQHPPGVSIAVVRGADSIALKGYGLADVENQVPATAGTVYRIG